jgi:hypothetical protein
VTTATEPRAGRRPDSWDAFRWAHLLIVLAVFKGAKRRNPLTVPRLTTYDFFAGHPYLVFADSESDEQRQLLLSGFEVGSLVYAAAPQRLSNRRQQMQSDLTALLARTLAGAHTEDGHLAFAITTQGEQIVDAMWSLHAQAVKVSARLVIRHFDRLSDTALRQTAADLSEDNALAVDIFGVV